MRKHPLFMLLITILVSISSYIVSYALFPSHATVLAAAFITLGLVPIVHRVLIKEEEEEAHTKRSFTTFFARHFNIIMIFIWIFVGVIISTAFVYALSPTEIRAELFSEQIEFFCFASGDCSNNTPFSISGQASSILFDACFNTGTSSLVTCFEGIFWNNFGVLVFTVILSLLYGAGAIFIVTWNASILGVFFGEMLLVGSVEKGLGLFQGLLLGHGPPELLGYVFAALAGAILSVMVAKSKLEPHEVSIIIKDVLFLTALAIFSVFYGAVTEAAGILGMDNLYLALGFMYLLILIVVIVFYGKQVRPTSKRSKSQ